MNETRNREEYAENGKERGREWHTWNNRIAEIHGCAQDICVIVFL